MSKSCPAGRAGETGTNKDGPGERTDRDPDRSRHESGQVHESGPDETPEETGEVTDTETSRDGSTDRARRAPDRSQVTGTSRDGSQGRDQTRRRREPGESERQIQVGTGPRGYKTVPVRTRQVPDRSQVPVRDGTGPRGRTKQAPDDSQFPARDGTGPRDRTRRDPGGSRGCQRQRNTRQTAASRAEWRYRKTQRKSGVSFWRQPERGTRPAGMETVSPRGKDSPRHPRIPGTTGNQ